MNTTTTTRRKMSCLDGNTLKIIAIVTMIIDHIGAFAIRDLVPYSNTMLTRLFNGDKVLGIEILYFALRSIGRLAFPIFCFLLVEGFIHTRSLLKYALNLLVFALISEVPFDLAMYGVPFVFLYQNVFFTLLIGLLALVSMRYIREKMFFKKSGLISFLKEVCFWLTGVLFMIIAQILHCDYGAFGILIIIVLYTNRQHNLVRTISGTILFVINLNEIPALYPCY